MAKHLQFSADDSQHWDLPEETDLDEVRRVLKNAVTSDKTATITVRVGSVSTPLLVNGKTLTVCAVYETPPAMAYTI